jgi:hypothetical protein
MTAVAESRPATRADRYLAIYLNDHLAGATGALELAIRMMRSHADHATQLRSLVAQLAADRERLRTVMRALDVRESRAKTGAAWVLEKLGRLKPNGHLRSRSPLSDLVELEGAALTLEAKQTCWRTLRARAEWDHRLDTATIDDVLDRTRRQGEMVAELRSQHVGVVAGPPR